MRRLSTVLMVGVLMASCSTEEEIPFSGRLVDFQVVDEANLDVLFSITNEGEESAKGECFVMAFDSSLPVGSDTFASRKEIGPGESMDLAGSIRIEDEGAFRVVDVEISDCQEATF